MTKALQRVRSLKSIVSADSVIEQFRNSLKENSGAFVSSLIELYSGDSYLQNCEPKAVVQEALKAASLKLPINKSLGFAWIIPRKNNNKLEPNFQIGYKGYIQLAMRTGKYRCINADSVPAGIEIEKDLLSGSIKFTGNPKKGEVKGYFGHFELLNGFTKTLYMTVQEIKDYAKKYSQSVMSSYSPWQKHFESMAKKTLLSILLRTYGIMSTEMMNAIAVEKQEVLEEKEIASKSMNFEDAETEEINQETGEITDKSEVEELPDVFNI